MAKPKKIKHSSRKPSKSLKEDDDPKIRSNQIIQNIIKQDLQNRQDLSLMNHQYLFNLDWR